MKKPICLFSPYEILRSIFLLTPRCSLVFPHNYGLTLIFPHPAHRTLGRNARCRLVHGSARAPSAGNGRKQKKNFKE